MRVICVINGINHLDEWDYAYCKKVQLRMFNKPDKFKDIEIKFKDLGDGKPTKKDVIKEWKNFKSELEKENNCIEFVFPTYEQYMIVYNLANQLGFNTYFNNETIILSNVLQKYNIKNNFDDGDLTDISKKYIELCTKSGILVEGKLKVKSKVSVNKNKSKAVTKSIKKIAVAKPKNNNAIYTNNNTFGIKQTLKYVCDELSFSYELDGNILTVHTLTRDWQFNILERPIKLRARPEGGGSSFEDVNLFIYSPLNAMLYIAKATENEMVEYMKKLDNVIY